jgi:sulfur transfer complex TusBCD TusB component (DsrH family)
MSCAFSSMILSRRLCHVIHIGDTRAYRLSEGRLERLTQDHIAGRGDFAHLLNRAIGFEEFARFDYTTIGLRQHDRLLLCSDGVHAALADHRLQELLGERTPPKESARAIVDAALAAGSSDNTTALVVDVVDLPPADRDELTHSNSTLPILDLPSSGEIRDEFALGEILSDGRYTRLFRAIDRRQGREVVLKFSASAHRERRIVPARVRARGVRRRARAQPVDRGDHRTADGAAKPVLFGNAAVRGRNA